MMKLAVISLTTAALFAAVVAVPARSQDAERASSLFQFDGASGYAPQGGVITNHQGTIFGTTTIGGDGPCSGDAGCGTVFALSPPPRGGTSWVFTKLYDFQGGQDGSSPSAQLTLGPAESLFGYATGGTFGTVFQLLPPAIAGSPWTFHILYVFSGQGDGNLESVYSPLLFRQGALYGIASGGTSKACGQFGCGSVFRLMPGPASGRWTKETLFSFTGDATSGQPSWIAAPGDAQELFVSTALTAGAVVALTPPASGGEWTENVITEFAGGNDGRYPANLVLASTGVLYGLANKKGGGLAFQLVPPAAAGSGWTRTTIADISDHGYGPVSLAVGTGGALIGAVEGDFDFFAGSVFELTRPSAGVAWTYTELWNFNHGPDRNPLNVVTGLGGNLFGVLNGGDSSNGSLFELH